MDDDHEVLLWGIELRYVLTRYLLDRSPATVADLLGALDNDGFRVGGRRSKTVSDALRTEVGRGRVLRRGRSSYTIGAIPGATERRIRRRVAAIRAGRGRHGPCPIRLPKGTSWTDRSDDGAPVLKNWNVF